jgi:multiple antibiotic resistance protein
MTEFTSLFLASFSALFAIMNPIAMTPFFIGLTKDTDDKTKKAVAFKGVIVAFFIVTVFILSGSFLFQFFGITIPGFKIFGGLLLALVGLEMVQSKKPSTKNTKIKLEDFDINQAISPLATPILAGPGTIVTSMNFVDQSQPMSIIASIIAFGLVCFLTYLAFRSSDYIVKTIGDNVIQVIAKIMGLIIGVIGIDMFIAGVKMDFF